MFWLMMVLSFVVMYIVMFSMVDRWVDFRNNLNMFYMTITMWAPMGVIMLLAMRGMYRNTKANVAMLALFVLLTVGSFAATRTQFLMGDQPFIDSMIPHHSGAILMCDEAPISDLELQELCVEIKQGQREEIDQMERIAERLED